VISANERLGTNTEVDMRGFVGADVIAAEIFGGLVTGETVLRYARLGIIPSVRVHRHPVLFDPEDVRLALLEWSKCRDATDQGGERERRHRT
jgi:hypothetical protein